MWLRCTEETELVTKSEQDSKLLQQAISQLQLELRTTTKQAKESQQPKVWNRYHSFRIGLTEKTFF